MSFSQDDLSNAECNIEEKNVIFGILIVSLVIDDFAISNNVNLLDLNNNMIKYAIQSFSRHPTFW